MNHHKSISKRQTHKIRLTGTRSTGYLVLSGGLDGLLPIAAPSARIGRAIVRALRELVARNQEKR